MVHSLPLLSCESSVSVKENPDRNKNRPKTQQKLDKIGKRHMTNICGSCPLKSDVDMFRFHFEILTKQLQNETFFIVIINFCYIGNRINILDRIFILQ